MSEDFYCEEVLSGIPKKHISSLLTLEESDSDLLLELIDVVKIVAKQVVSQYGASRVLTNLGAYQDSKHLHWHVFYGKQIRN